LKLIIDSNPSAWARNDDVLFLGRWCTEALEDKSLLPDLFTVFSPPISSIEEKRRRFEFVESLFEPLLHDLAASLNVLHNTNYSIRYWRISTGLWLYQFLDIAYSRWCRLDAVLESAQVTSASIPQISKVDACPPNRREFTSGLQSENWNSAIFAFFLQRMLTCEMTEYPSAPQPKPVRPPSRKPRVAKMFFQGLTKLINARGSAVLTTTYLPRFAEFKLAACFCQLPTLWDNDELVPDTFSMELRTQISLNPSAYIGFESAVRALIPMQIPKTVIEGYKDTLNRINLKKLPRTPKIVFTANRHASNDSFAIWAAEKAEVGSRLVLGQHGGLYGEGLFPTRHEQHEIAVSDSYVTWGWDDRKYKNISPGPAFVNIAKKSRGLSNDKTSLLIMTDSTLRYGKYCWDGTEEGTQYLSDQVAAIKGLDDDIKGHVVVRLYDSNARDDMPHSLFWRNKLPNVELSDGASSIAVQRSKARLVLCTTLGTSQIETMSQNVPTLIFCNPLIVTTRHEATDVFKSLKMVGIYHETPESLSAHINKIWPDVDEWWHDPATQQACDAYCLHYAREIDFPVWNLAKLIRGQN